jgi:hypothetical protein
VKIKEIRGGNGDISATARNRKRGPTEDAGSTKKAPKPRTQYGRCLEQSRQESGFWIGQAFLSQEAISVCLAWARAPRNPDPPTKMPGFLPLIPPRPALAGVAVPASNRQFDPRPRKLIVSVMVKMAQALDVWDVNSFAAGGVTVPMATNIIGFKIGVTVMGL